MFRQALFKDDYVPFFQSRRKVALAVYATLMAIATVVLCVFYAQKVDVILFVKDQPDFPGFNQIVKKALAFPVCQCQVEKVPFRYFVEYKNNPVNCTFDHRTYFNYSYPQSDPKLNSLAANSLTAFTNYINDACSTAQWMIKRARSALVIRTLQSKYLSPESVVRSNTLATIDQIEGGTTKLLSFTSVMSRLRYNLESPLSLAEWPANSQVVQIKYPFNTTADKQKVVEVFSTTNPMNNAIYSNSGRRDSRRVSQQSSQVNITYCQDKDADSCTVDVRCQYNTRVQFCEPAGVNDDCSFNSAGCATKSLCKWYGFETRGICYSTMNCSGYSSSADCESTFRGSCVWDWSNKVCKQSPTPCEYPRTESQCKALSYCQWLSETGSCSYQSTVDCTRLFNAANCSSNSPACIWSSTGSRCKDNIPYQIYTGVDRDSTTGCASLVTPASCSQQSGCFWSNAECVDLQSFGIDLSEVDLNALDANAIALARKLFEGTYNPDDEALAQSVTLVKRLDCSKKYNQVIFNDELGLRVGCTALSMLRWNRMSDLMNKVFQLKYKKANSTATLGPYVFQTTPLDIWATLEQAVNDAFVPRNLTFTQWCSSFDPPLRCATKKVADSRGYMQMPRPDGAGKVVNVRYEDYYNVCRPQSCQWQERRKRTIVEVVLTVVGVIGGINTVCAAIVGVAVSLYTPDRDSALASMLDEFRREAHTKKVVVGGPAESESPNHNGQSEGIKEQPL